MKRGGKKPGAGRPKGTIAKSTAIALKLKEIMARKLNERFGPIMDAQLDVALGIQSESYDKKTGALIYKDFGPNVIAFKNILEQVVGRPKETVDIGNKDNIPFILKLDR